MEFDPDEIDDEKLQRFHERLEAAETEAELWAICRDEYGRVFTTVARAAFWAVDACHRLADAIARWRYSP